MATNPSTGTWRLVRVLLRRDRIKLPAWLHDLSPLDHIGRVPLEDAGAVPMLVLCGSPLPRPRSASRGSAAGT